MALADLTSELAGTLPGLSPILATKYVNRAWDHIQRERRWGFLQQDGVLVCPTMIVTGACAIVQYTTTVTCNAACSAALTPYIAGTPLLTQMQIRFGGSNTLTAGQIYRIMAVDATNPAALVLTTDRMVVEATNATSTYQCYRCYVEPPDNFLSWDAVTDMVYGFPIKRNWTSAQFDQVDPQRTSQGDAYYIGFFRSAGYGDPNVEAGSSLYELWPAPTNGRNYYVRYTALGQAFVQPYDTQPAIISDALIMARAYGWHAYPFAQANVANFPTLKHTNWPTLIAAARAEYKEELQVCKKNDDANALQTVYNRGHGLRSGGGLPFPIDAAYIQSHLLSF